VSDTLLRGDGEGEDGVFSENCRMIRKKETIMLQMADLMGSSSITRHSGVIIYIAKARI